MSDGDHAALAERLGEIKGMAIISGYRCDLYDELYKDWPRHDRETQSGQNKRRVESVWLSRNIAKTNRLF
jgi:DNA adenine methylase